MLRRLEIVARLDEDRQQGWPGVRAGIRGTGALPAQEQQTGNAQDGNLLDLTDATKDIKLRDQIEGAIADRMPAPGVAPGEMQETQQRPSRLQALFGDQIAQKEEQSLTMLQAMERGR
jgi:hypothetical protein